MHSFVKTPEQKKLMEQIKALQPSFRAREPELDALGSFPFKDIEELKQIDYHLLTLPKENGGQGFGLYEYILAQEAISEGSGSTGLSIGWHNGIVLEYAENRHWNKNTGQFLLDEIRKGALINSAGTENNTGSPTRGGLPQTSAIADGEDLIINGEKTYTSLSPVLDYFLVSATTEEQEVEHIMVPRTATGLSIKQSWDSMAMRGTASDTIVLKNVRVPKTNILKKNTPVEPVSKGWLLHIPACYIGIAAAARNYALEFATSYVPVSLGKPIAEVPSIRQKIGEMELELSTARHLMYGTIERYEAASDKTTFEEALNVTKIAVTKAAISIVDIAMKIVGSRAFSESNPMHRYYLNVRAGLYNPPMDDVVISKMANKAIQSLNKDATN
ncbi:acyl-CoA dehydrogenase family protein [Sporosarcina sp. P33]|uniref:acyl-CoA dehydrogenase family protein n=1 Tax=Sporosarcina sp. P33 TaxID=1930764 RepID=UPI0009BC978F|nr:acyl-CoA dehydrogenase family protein [Sporosarcina sp. P33]ARD48604.1 acyl-CoA dehydrogenase [Sporosarcina sp. P33]